jgi:hypothetical protein
MLLQSKTKITVLGKLNSSGVSAGTNSNCGGGAGGSVNINAYILKLNGAIYASGGTIFAF